VQHEPNVKLPAVSGSSGHLVVEQLKSTTDPQGWPGQIFADPDLGYEEAMQAYIAATQDRLHVNHQEKGKKGTKGGRKSKKQALWRANQVVREARYPVRERRKAEDGVWNAVHQELRREQAAFQALSKAERHQQRSIREAWERRWGSAWAHHRVAIIVRQQEDAQWQTERRQLREGAFEDFSTPAWLAILVMTDNCTRQCLGLPLFVAGPKVTAEMVVAALSTLLPPELHYLISDQGVHFRTQTLAQVARQHDFIWVPVACHRPQSNGIAERFVRTLKEWLGDKTWQSPAELDLLLADFLLQYNVRPHQGLPIPGLSPDEFANRIWLM
jgi:transposase InsO family protein